MRGLSPWRVVTRGRALGTVAGMKRKPAIDPPFLLMHNTKSSPSKKFQMIQRFLEIIDGLKEVIVWWLTLDIPISKGVGCPMFSFQG